MTSSKPFAHVPATSLSFYPVDNVVESNSLDSTISSRGGLAIGKYIEMAFPYWGQPITLHKDHTQFSSRKPSLLLGGDRVGDWPCMSKHDRAEIPLQ